MRRKHLNPARVKIHWNYTARELADRLGVHKNTIRHWQRHGLAPLDQQRPYLFHGATVRAFLAQRRQRRKRPCPTGTLYCFRCREPRRPKPNSVEYLQMRAQTGNLRAVCNECGTVMHRRTRQAAIATILPGLLVQIREAPRRLKWMDEASTNCALRAGVVK